MKEFTVKFKVTLPDKVSVEQLEEFLKYELQMMGSMSCENPLADQDISEIKPRNLEITSF